MNTMNSIGLPGIATVSTIAALLCAGAAGAQVASADVSKNLEYVQVGPSAVVPLAADNAFLYARTFFPNASDFDGGNLTFSGPGSPQTFNISGNLGSPFVGYQTGYLTQANLDAMFPNGITYTLTATNSSTLSSQAVNVTYATDVYTSDLPALTAASYAALQSANPNAAVTLDFNSFTQNPGASFAQGFLTIYDLTTNTYVDSFNGFAPTTTSETIAPGVLTAGDQYQYELIFEDAVTGNDGSVATYAVSNVRTLGLFTVPLGVPEPATWTMMLIGVAALGSVARRRRSLATAL